jgi:hypothetical protein
MISLTVRRSRFSPVIAATSSTGLAGTTGARMAGGSSSASASPSGRSYRPRWIASSLGSRSRRGARCGTVQTVLRENGAYLSCRQRRASRRSCRPQLDLLDPENPSRCTTSTAQNKPNKAAIKHRTTNRSFVHNDESPELVHNGKRVTCTS